jgi:branched-chain amino acid transport system substrate-binding protein
VSNGANPPMNTSVTTTALDRGDGAVLALIGSVGTPTAVRAVPVTVETHTLFYGPFTGAGSPLRDTSEADCQKYVFNVRASYSQEGIATMEYFQNNGVTVTNAANLISFDQSDSFGDAGYKAMTNAWIAVNTPAGGTAPPPPTIERVRYTRNDLSTVSAAVTTAESYITSLMPASPATLDIGIQMTDVYSIGAMFIQQLRQWQFSTGPGARLHLHFSNISFVGADALAQQLHALGQISGAGFPYTRDVLISQVVPNYQTSTISIVNEYKQLASAAGQPGNFTSLEGYIAMKIFIQGLLQVNGPITPDAMIPQLENLQNLSLGLGATAGFSSTNHQYLDSVWGTAINDDGTFADTYDWTVSPSTAPLGTFSSF